MAVLDAREALISELARRETCEVLIVGAGINGAAVYRDLSLQGVACVLVDAEDFGAGASSASTRMAHGGLRYLETGQLRLVAEATRERDRLLVNAGHTIHPLEVTIPLFSTVGGVWGSLAKLFGRQTRLAQRGLLLVETGLLLYDLLGRRSRALPTHRLRGRAAARRRFPALHPAMQGAVSYFDAAIGHAERVAFELVAEGSAAGGLAVNHVAVEAQADGTVVLGDRLAGRRFAIRPALVINAGGAWIDEVNARLGKTTRLIDGTKGSHLVIDSPALHRALDGSAFSWDDGQGRMCIMYPLGDRVLLGSTDIRVERPEQAVCDEGEVAYLLSAVRLIFPWIELRGQDIRFRFCGVRPLPRSDQADTVNISRDHHVAVEAAEAGRPFAILSLVGGKWTTFRAFAEQVTDRVLALSGRTRRVSTVDAPIGGGAGLPRDERGRAKLAGELAASTGLSPGRAAALVARYGTAAAPIAAHCAVGADAPLSDAPDYSRREIDWIARRELAVCLADVLLRRTILAVGGRLTGPLVADVAAVLDEALGRTPEESRRDLEAFRARLAREHGLVLDIPEPATPAVPRMPALAVAGAAP